MDNSEEIKMLEDKILKLKEDEKEYNESPEKRRLAEVIHNKMCRWNHIDGCSWGYESWADIGRAREKYLKKAVGILKVVDYETAINVIYCL